MSADASGVGPASIALPPTVSVDLTRLVEELLARGSGLAAAGATY